MFIRRQLSPYCIQVEVTRTTPSGMQWVDEVVQPAMHTPGPTPHGRNAYTGSKSDWGPDRFGYTGFDDYHLALYGA